MRDLACWIARGGLFVLNRQPERLPAPRFACWLGCRERLDRSDDRGGGLRFLVWDTFLDLDRRLSRDCCLELCLCNFTPDLPEFELRFLSRRLRGSSSWSELNSSEEELLGYTFLDFLRGEILANRDSRDRLRGFFRSALLNSSGSNLLEESSDDSNDPHDSWSSDVSDATLAFILESIGTSGIDEEIASPSCWNKTKFYEERVLIHHFFLQTALASSSLLQFLALCTILISFPVIEYFFQSISTNHV